jgi:hypothetical protein
MRVNRRSELVQGFCRGRSAYLGAVRYQWRKTGSQMVLYEDEAGTVVAAAIEQAAAASEDLNYVASGPLIGTARGYRRYREAMEAVEELVRQSGGTMVTSHRDFLYRPL